MKTKLIIIAALFTLNICLADTVYEADARNKVEDKAKREKIQKENAKQRKEFYKAEERQQIRREIVATRKIVRRAIVAKKR